MKWISFPAVSTYRSPAKWIEKISLFPPFSATSKGPPFLIYHTSGKKARCVPREIAQHTFTQRTFAYIHIAHISLGRHEEDISIRGKRQMEAKHSSPLRRRPHHSFPLLRPRRIGGGGGARRRMGEGDVPRNERGGGRGSFRIHTASVYICYSRRRRPPPLD